MKKKKSEVKKKKVQRLNYAKESVDLALREISKGKQIAETSRKYGIPESTLRAKKLGIYANKKPGPAPVLNVEEEKCLVEWILYCSAKGFPVTKAHLIESVKTICKNLKKKNPFKDDKPGRSWYEGFLKRNPSIAIRVAENLCINRARVTELSLRNWFQEISKYLENENLIEIEPERIFNCDETAIPLNPAPSTVLAQKGQKNVYNIVSNQEKTNITVLVTCNAAGDLAPSLVLFAGKCIPKRAAENAPKDFALGHSENGWMLAENFYEYVANIFEPWLKENNIKRPVILYVDGHSSHITMHLSTFCSEHKIVLVTLHPNATHIIQPLDVAFFKALKMKWYKIYEEFCKTSLCVGIQKFQLAPLLKRTYDSMNIKVMLQNGFEKCGLYPLNANAIDYSKVIEKNQQLPAVGYEQSSNDKSITKDMSLEVFKKFLTQEQIEAFTLNTDSTWNGVEKDKSLFEIWCKLSNLKNNVASTNRVNNHESNSNPTSNINLENKNSSSAVPEKQAANVVTKPTPDFNNLKVESNTSIYNKNEDCLILPLDINDLLLPSMDNQTDLNISDCNISLEFISKSRKEYELSVPENITVIEYVDNKQSQRLTECSIDRDMTVEAVIGELDDKESQRLTDSTIYSDIVPLQTVIKDLDDKQSQRLAEVFVDEGLVTMQAVIEDLDSNQSQRVKNRLIDNKLIIESGQNDSENFSSDILSNTNTDYIKNGILDPLDIIKTKDLLVTTVTTRYNNEVDQPLDLSADTKASVNVKEDHLKINPLNDITNFNQQKSVKPVKEYLFWPNENIVNNIKAKKRNKCKPPSVISGPEWQKYFKEKEVAKEKKLEETVTRKKIKLEKKEANKIKKEEEKLHKEQKRIQKQKEKLDKEKQRIEEIENKYKQKENKILKIKKEKEATF